jgi:hypothetical protein
MHTQGAAGSQVLIESIGDSADDETKTTLVEQTRPAILQTTTAALDDLFEKVRESDCVLRPSLSSKG